MKFEAGEVVILKSGGQPMTVVSVSEPDVECVWMSEDGELFREKIPAAALLNVGLGDDDEDEAGDDEQDDEHEDDDGDDEGKEGESAKKGGKRRVA